MRRRRNPLTGPGSGPNQAVLVGLVGLGVLGIVGIAYAATRPAAAAKPAPVKRVCGDGTLQFDCTGHDALPSPIIPPQPLPPTWTPVDLASPTAIQAGQTYRGSFTGSVGGPEVVALTAFLTQGGLAFFQTPASDWPDPVDGADPARVKLEGTAFASGPAPTAFIPSLKMWRKS